MAEGAKVAITGRNQATLEAAAKELGPNAIAIVADATDIAATEKAVKQAAAKFGKLDIVFANAGIAANTPLGGTTLETFEIGAPDQCHRGVLHGAGGACPISMTAPRSS